MNIVGSKDPIDLKKLSSKELMERRAWIRGVLGEQESALIRYVHQIMGKDLDSAQEVVQEAFLRLWDRSPVDVESYVREWLFRVCRNLAIDIKRKESRMSAQEVQLDTWVDESPSVEEQLDQKQRQEIVAELVKKLKPQQQEILRLKFQEGLSYHEISRVTGHTVNHIGVLIYNITKKIRKNFEKQVSKEQKQKKLKLVTKDSGSLD